MDRGRDVPAFEARAARYETGWLGHLHRDIADRVADLAVAQVSAPGRILDVGCGTGYLLRRLAVRFPAATSLSGIDPAPGMIHAARAAATDFRLAFITGTAEHLPYHDATFDVVVSTTSFDHWRDQRAGLAECGRVLRSGGVLVLADLFSARLAPTLLGSRRSKARTKRRASILLLGAGLLSPQWLGLGVPLLKAVTAAKPGDRPAAQPSEPGRREGDQDQPDKRIR